MSQYKYTALRTDGKQVHGKLEAVSVKGAMATLVDRDLDVKALKEKKSVLKFEITREKLKLADVMHLSRQLAAFTRAGVPLPDAIQVIEEEAKDKTLRKVLSAIRGELRTGESFSGALRPYETLFPQFYVDMLRAAELGGTLDRVLEDMSGYIERDLEARQKIKSAITYPIVILVSAVATVVLLAAFVLPRFKMFFESFDAQLPLPTRMLIVVTDFLSAWWLAIIGGLIFLFVAFALLFKARWGRMQRDRLLLKVPLVGELIRFSIIERFSRLLAAMMEAGVPLPEAMAVLARGTNSLVFEEGLGEVREAMLRGEGLARPMAQAKLFPGAVIQMIRVGENTGTLGDQLENTSRYYGHELEYKIKRLTTLFEPAVILFMGLVVGFVAIALVSAMYGIYSQVNV
jgi:type IV pilus assembly protein PilC